MRSPKIDGYSVVTFSDIMRRVTLSWEQVDLEGQHHDGQKYHEFIVPFKSKDDRRSAIGVLQPYSLILNRPPTDLFHHVAAGTAAAAATPELLPGDIIREVNGKEVKDYFELTKALEKTPR
jgi:hypothetical protein